MRKQTMKRIMCIVVASAFLVNNIAYGLSPMPGSTQPGTRTDMYALAQKLFAAKSGPGAIDFDNYGAVSFIGNELLSRPDVGAYIEEANGYKTRFVKADYDNPPEAWKNNPILKETDLISALKAFRDTEAKIPAENLDIKEGYFPVDEEKGELPIARIEKVGENKYVLVVHTKFVQMWKHIRKNDVWFEANLGPDDRRTLSVAWGIFYRLAKHELTDLKRGNIPPKSVGHIGSYNGEVILVKNDEVITNMMGGNHRLLNDSIWMWFLGAYCFSNTTRYNNETFLQRINWMFDGKGATELRLDSEFPQLLSNGNNRTIAMAFAYAINYNFFNRPDMVVPKTSVDERFIREYGERVVAHKAIDITEEPIYVTGRKSEARMTRRDFIKTGLGVTGLTLIAGKWERRLKASQYQVDPESAKTAYIGRYSVEEVANDPVKAGEFLNEYLSGERIFFDIVHRRGMAVDGWNLNPETLEPETIRELSAASKESLDIAVLVKALAGNDLAAQVVDIGDKAVARQKAIDLLKEKIDSYEQFNRDFPVFGGFLPWIKITNRVQPASDWQDRVPALDNGEWVWSLYAVYHTLDNIGERDLSARYKNYFNILQRNAVPIFYDQDLRKIRAVARIKDPGFIIVDPNNYENSVANYFLDNPHEGIMMAYFLTLFTDLPVSEKDNIWSDINIEKVTTVDSSVHIKWPFIFLPITDNATAMKVFGMQEKIRTVVNKYGTPSSTNTPGRDGYTQYDPNIFAPYGAFGMILYSALNGDVTKNNYGLAWLLNMLNADKMVGPSGSGESFSVIPGTNVLDRISFINTCDGKMSIWLAMMGGVVSEIRDSLKKDRLYGQFRRIVDAEYAETFGDPDSVVDDMKFLLPAGPIVGDYKPVQPGETTDLTDLLDLWQYPTVDRWGDGAVGELRDGSLYITYKPTGGDWGWVGGRLRETVVPIKGSAIYIRGEGDFTLKLETASKDNVLIEIELRGKNVWTKFPLDNAVGKAFSVMIIDHITSDIVIAGMKYSPDENFPFRAPALVAVKTPGGGTRARVTNAASLSEAISIPPTIAGEHPIIWLISEYIVKLGVKEGPGAETLSTAELENIYRTVNLLREDNIEIFIPQQVRLTENMQKAIKDMGKKEGGNYVTCRQYADLQNLARLLQSPSIGKRIVITDIAEEKDREQMGRLVAEYPESFRATRLLNVTLPANYSDMDNIEKTVCQAKIVTIAILARLFEKNKTPMVEMLLRHMIKSCLDVNDKGMNEYLDELGNPNDGQGLSREALVKRILFLIGKTIKVVERIGREIRLMKAFWTAA